MGGVGRVYPDILLAYVARSQESRLFLSPGVTPVPLQAELQHVSISPGCDEPEGAPPGRCVPGSPCLASLGCGLWAVDQEGLLGPLNLQPHSRELAVGGAWEPEIAKNYGWQLCGNTSIT